MKGRRPPTASNSWWPAEGDPNGCNLDEGKNIPYNESHHSESWSKHPHAFILFYFTLYLNYYFPMISEWFKDGLCPFCGLAFLSQWSGFKSGFVLANLSICRETPSYFLFSTPVCLSFSNKNHLSLIKIGHFNAQLIVLDGFQILNFQVLYSVARALRFVGKLKVVCRTFQLILTSPETKVLNFKSLSANIEINFVTQLPAKDVCRWN